ncbi:MAG: sensor histidine kinase [Rhodocyclaceae bacterium]|nr:sensor histidine kinase [Rhodocyclaceae bacterium]
MRAAASLRGHLLALLLPIAVVAILGGVFAVYLIAQRASAEALDEGLADAARLYVAELRARAGEALPELPPHAQRVLLATPEDRVFFSLLDAEGRLLAGAPVSEEDLSWGSLEAPAFFDLNHSGYWLRGISLVFEARGQARHLVLATTALKRERLIGEIMLGLVLPQLTLLFFCILLVWFGVRQGLAPLAALKAEIGRRSHEDLRPLETQTAPEELQPIIEEVNALFERLARAIAAQRDFLADAAHQLRTPIAGLLAQLEADGHQDNPALLLTARRLSRLIGQLLTLSRAEPGIEREQADFDLAALIREEANLWLPQAFRREIEMRFELAPAPLYASPQAYREMLANLVDNAIRYGRRGGQIVVSCASLGDEVVLRVDDDGPGIPPHERARVFERFYRGRAASAEGCGLGLAIVAALARQQGATIRLDTAPKLGGLRAELRAPRRASQESSA